MGGDSVGGSREGPPGAGPNPNQSIFRCWPISPMSVRWFGTWPATWPEMPKAVEKVCPSIVEARSAGETLVGAHGRNVT